MSAFRNEIPLPYLKGRSLFPDLRQKHEKTDNILDMHEINSIKKCLVVCKAQTKWG